MGALETYIVLLEAQAVRLAGVRALRLSPSMVMALSFLGLIAMGTGLLLTPAATPADRPISFVDALFTATSAGRITGLTVRTTADDFTRTGQWLILGMIQMGGLGIMTFAATLGRGLSMRDQVLIREILRTDPLGPLRTVIAFLLISTFAFEAAGAAVIYALDPAGGAGGAAERAFYAVFHSVSAFCHAGFSLYPDGLARFAHDDPVIAVYSTLILIGSVGYLVLLHEPPPCAGARIAGAFRRRRGPGPRLLLQTRLVVITSLALPVAGAVLIAASEWRGRAMAGWDGASKVANAVFLSITGRSAGLTASDIAPSATGTLLVMMSSCSSAGRPRRRRAASRRHVLRAVRAPPRPPPPPRGDRGFRAHAPAPTDPHVPLASALFEAISAHGTVGLSTGITPTLSTAGKVAGSVAMLAGRIGPLTLILALAERAPVSGRFATPTGRVMIG